MREQRRLKSENLVTPEVYKTYLKVSLQAHNVWDRVQRLWELAKDRVISKEQIVEYNNIDLTITEFMLAEEGHLPYQGIEGFLAEQQLIL